MPSLISFFCPNEHNRNPSGGRGGKCIFNHKYKDIIKIENLLLTWERFLRGKKQKKDVVIFQLRLADNLTNLYYSLANYTYKHGAYSAFTISDPKLRNIHKATVRDRVLHHLIYKELYPYFDKKFIYDSYSCRKNKGTHRAIKRFKYFACRVSKNNSRTCYILKCDIKKFFANIDHKVLLDILNSYIPDKQIIWLLKEIIESFSSKPGIGLPLGNLTSQLFVNIYMNEFDQFVKHELKIKYYIRYADDFVVLSDDKKWLEKQIFVIQGFLFKELKLELHPDKVSIKTLASGVDFLGWVNFPYHRVLRTTTKRRMLRRIVKSLAPETLNSYLGLLRHGNTGKLQKEVYERIKIL